MKIKLFLCISVVLLIPNSVLSQSCPACLGTVGVPLRGQFLTSLTSFDFDIRYRETYESSNEFWRKTRVLNPSLVYNIEESDLSFGATLPLVFSERFMFDRIYSKDTTISGIDLFSRYSFFKDTNLHNQSTFMGIFGVKLPIGTIISFENRDIKTPFGLLTGIGGSLIISEPFIFYGSFSYLFNFKDSTQYSFGDRLLGTIGINTSLDIGLPSMIGIDTQFVSNFSDNDPTNPSIAENTNRQVISIGPKFNVLIFNNPKTTFDVTFGIPVLESKLGTMQLSTNNILEVSLGIGF